MSSESLSRRCALRAGAAVAATGVTVLALPGAIAAASEDGSSGNGYGGYTAQQIADFLNISFSNTGGNRSLGFSWTTTSPTNNVAYTSSISGSITGSPVTGTASGGTIPSASVPGWDDGETLSVTLTATFPFTATITFDLDANGRPRNFMVDGVPVTNPFGPYAGYSAQEIANMVGFNFVSVSGNRSLGFTWITPSPEDVTYGSSVTGPFISPTPPWIGTSSDGVVTTQLLTGWGPGETLNCTLVSTLPFAATVTFDIASNGGTSNWAVDGGSVTNPNDL